MRKKHTIGDFMKRIKRPVELITDKEYKLVTIKMNHKGVILRELKKGAEIKSNMFQVKEGDFILSGIDARNGAFGIVPAELDGAIVTNDFWYFDIDESVINKQLFLQLTSTTWFDEICKRGSDGTTQRIRLQKDKFLNQEIYLPSPNIQNELLLKIHSVKSKQTDFNKNNILQLEQIKQLRQTILQEAIQGKLTENWRVANPGIEPASHLLSRIKHEKQRLVDEKKIKLDKPLPPINEEQMPYVLPDSWVWCRLGDTGLFGRGKSKHRPRNDAILFKFGTYPFVQTGDVAQSKTNDYLINSYSQKYNEAGLSQSKIWPAGTLCITIAANIAETGFLGIDACFPDSVVGFNSLIDNVTTKYIKYFIDISRKEIEKFAPATAQKNINLGIINTLCVPFPPLSEQKIIVEKVDTLIKKCRDLEEKIKQNSIYAEQLMQSLIKEAFDPTQTKQKIVTKVSCENTVTTI
ncbi:EcoKI restriction-modification system protein HsdS [Legionella steelei]|uniref:EcoKI restriction-modification system protein HsdS n=1 Tax=Legionella steelei TaxID=947033 RepID=A0A0W0ZC93_9GAMM|nr:restriction endonuclease subunit S [Legionella steelei]KTD66727.1 EcoKI restriction-modification system protein HsdS [Legionella steelei]